MFEKRLSYVLFICFLLVLSIVNAVEITTQGVSGSLCPRETGQFTHIIKNDNNVIKDYSLKVKGSASQWATVVPGGFILAPKEEKTIFTYVTPTQSAEAGNYNLEIEASSPGESKSVSHTVVVKDCYNANLAAVPSSKVSCPGDALQYSVVLTNSGEYTETFKLSLTGNLASRTSLSDNLIILGKKENKNILLFVNSPVDAGDYSLTLTVESESGRVRESIPVFLKVNPCYDFILKVNGNNTYNMCDRSYVVVPLNLRNAGSIINTYNINIEGPEWAKVEKTEFTLKDQEARSFNLMFAPSYGTAGEYGIRLTTSPEKGNVKSVTDFEITVRKCHSVDVKFIENKADACKGALNNYESLITNDGEIKKSYRLELDGPPWVNIDEKDRLFTLNPKEQKKVILKAVPVSVVKDGNYDIKLKASANDDSAAAVTDTDKLTVNVKGAEECYKPKIESKYSDLVVYYDSSVAVPVEIRNDGVRRAEFSLFLSGNGVVFSRLTPSAVSLDPGKSEIVYLYVAPNVNIKLGNYDLSIALNIKEGSLLTAKKFNVEITDVKGRATPINSPDKENKDAVILQKQSYWQKLKSWFGRTFVGSKNKMNLDTLNTKNTLAVQNVTSDNLNNKGFFVKFFLPYKYFMLGVVLFILVVSLLIVIFKGDNSKKSKKKKTKEAFEDVKDNV